MSTDNRANLVASLARARLLGVPVRYEKQSDGGGVARYFFQMENSLRDLYVAKGLREASVWAAGFVEGLETKE